jgi:hypothetical protein
LFPLIVIIECFLHAFIKIRDRAKHLKETFQQIPQKVWEVYHSVDEASFRSQAQTLLSWAESNTTGPVLEAVRKLCAKVDRFVLAYKYPAAHRTSNMLDRHMDFMARWLDSSRFFTDIGPPPNVPVAHGLYCSTLDLTAQEREPS